MFIKQKKCYNANYQLNKASKLKAPKYAKFLLKDFCKLISLIHLR